MNKSTFFVGTIMLAAAAVFIYVEEPLTVRIICAAVFLICAVLLYFTIAGEKEEEGPEAMESGDTPRRMEKQESDETLPIDFDKRSEHLGTGDPVSGEVGTDGSQDAEAPALPYQRKEIHIPREYYRGGGDKIPADDPRGEFDFLVRNLLLVLKELLIAHSISLFWINRDRKQIVLGEHVTDSKQFTTTRRTPLGDDLISRIGYAGEPEIVSDIPANSEADLLPYYNTRQSVRSFVGVPVYFSGESIAVLAADSKASDAFGVETVATVGHFTTMIATLLRSYNQKYDLDADARLLATLDRMRKILSGQSDAAAIAAAGASAVMESVDWDYLAMVMYDPKKPGWSVVKSMAKSGGAYIPEGAPIEPEKGLIGKALLNTKAVIHPAPIFPDYRYSHSEKIDGAGQLCLIPVATTVRSFGLILVEHKEKQQYGERDIETIRRIAQYLALFLEVSSLSELARTQLLIDETTRVGSRTFLLKRLQEEYARAQAHGSDLTFYLIALDKPDAILDKYDRQGLSAALTHVAKTLQAVSKNYDVVARFDQHRFGVVSIRTNAEEAYLQGEKLRKAVAGGIITAGPMTFSATISVAGCVLSAGTDPVQALKALQLGQEKANAEGGNLVKIV